VFTRKSGLLRRRNRAVTLIEAVLYISIALALIVGGLVFFQQASTAAKTSTTVRQLSAILAETRVLMNGMTLTDLGTELPTEVLTPTLIAAGAVPPDMVKDAITLSNPFGGVTHVVAQFQGGVSDMIHLELTNIPQGVCARLLTSTSPSQQESSVGSSFDSTNVVSSGFLAGYALDPSTPPVDNNRGAFLNMNVTQAGWMCKYGYNKYTDKNTEPDSTPMSGNVTVVMTFRP
jgi:hypothetical protein